VAEGATADEIDRRSGNRGREANTSDEEDSEEFADHEISRAHDAAAPCAGARATIKKGAGKEEKRSHTACHTPAAYLFENSSLATPLARTVSGGIGGAGREGNAAPADKVRKCLAEGATARKEIGGGGNRRGEGDSEAEDEGGGSEGFADDSLHGCAPDEWRPPPRPHAVRQPSKIRVPGG
jgi:hypothetical protein